jgi:hypothetical protein
MTTTYTVDTFVRADNASSWGTASDGVTTYDNLSGNGTFSIASNEGAYTGVTSTWFVPIAFGSTTSTTVDITYRMSISDTGSKVGAFFNYATTGGISFYRLAYTGSSGDLRVEKRITGGSFTLVGSAATIATISSNTFYNMRMQCRSGVLKARMWADGAGEPTTWQLNVTDGSPLATGQFGIYLYAASSPVTWKFDHITATDGVFTSAKNAAGRVKVFTSTAHIRNGKGRVRVAVTTTSVKNGSGRVRVVAPAVVKTVGRVTGATGTNTMILGTTMLTDGEAMAQVMLSEVGSVAGVTLRYTSLTNFVRLRLLAATIELVQQTAAAFITLASYSFVPLINTKYWLKLRAVGVNMYGKIWRDGDIEPAWQIASTTTVVNAGQVGVSAALSSTTATIDFYTFQATTAAAGVMPPVLRNRDVVARGGCVERESEQTRNIRARARLTELLDVIEVDIYAAQRPPLTRKFPKS